MSIKKHLGQKTEYSSKYDPSLLVRERRSTNRKSIGIKDTQLPFKGVDIWNCYEFSFLNKGNPENHILKITYPADSKYIVESKSLKLYLNSFNMSIFSKAPYELIETDLSSLLKTKVQVRFFNPSYTPEKRGTYLGEYFPTSNNFDYTLPPVNLTSTELDYTENPKLLKGRRGQTQKIYLHSTLLRSNCKVTHQPDFGDVHIYIKSRYEVNPISILKYIISFRNENHFHEEVCETIYKRLLDRFHPTELLVYCQYTRRGGIDINPLRFTSNLETKVQDLLDVNKNFDRVRRQ